MNQHSPSTPIDPDPETQLFYLHAMRLLDQSGVPFMVGGGHAMAYYTGIRRCTKDLDLFIRPADRERALEVLARAGYKREYFYRFWISKALDGDRFIDILYNSGNGLCPVDDHWFAHALSIDVLGYRTRLVPAEEQLWSKAFVQDRDRFDGADVAHLILCRGEQFDWQRLLWRFQGNELVLLAQLLLFEYAFPAQTQCIPDQVINQLIDRTRGAHGHPPKACNGTRISQKGFLVAVNQWGFTDTRLRPDGLLTPEEVAQLPGLENS